MCPAVSRKRTFVPQIIECARQSVVKDPLLDLVRSALDVITSRLHTLPRKFSEFDGPKMCHKLLNVGPAVSRKKNLCATNY